MNHIFYYVLFYMVFPISMLLHVPIVCSFSHLNNILLYVYKFISFCSFILAFEGIQYLSQIEPTSILLFQPPKCWDYVCVSPRVSFIYLDVNLSCPWIVVMIDPIVRLSLCGFMFWFLLDKPLEVELLGACLSGYKFFSSNGIKTIFSNYLLTFSFSYWWYL